MPEHPCAEGLTSACFAAYPAWARQALAYKLLHILVPKQLTRRLPKGLNRALIGPDAIVPPGVVFPPGMVIPPGFTWRDSWTAWLNFIFSGVELPWTLFPKDWKPGDPLPPGVVLPPGVELPPGWTPSDPPPPFFIPGYTPVAVEPATGATPPLYVEPWGPGPTRPPRTTPSAPSGEAVLLFEEGEVITNIIIGDNADWTKIARPLSTPIHGTVTGVYVQLGRDGDPDGTVFLEIWKLKESGEPDFVIPGGVSTPKVGMTLDYWNPGMDDILFDFPDSPHLEASINYALVWGTTGTFDPSNCYSFGGGNNLVFVWYMMNAAGVWTYVDTGPLPYFKIYGLLG